MPSQGNNDPPKKTLCIGQRSIKRKRLAEKQLALLVDSKQEIVQNTTKLGFKVKASNGIPELRNCRISPPEGLVVACSWHGGLIVATMDYFRGPADSKKTMRCMDYVLHRYDETGAGNPSTFRAMIEGQQEEAVLAAFPWMRTIPFRCVRQGSFFNLQPGGLFGPGTYQFPDDWPAPSVMPLQGEETWLSMAGSDNLDDEGEFLAGNTLQESVKLAWASDAGSIGGRAAFLEQVLWFYRPTAIIQPIPARNGFMSVRPAAYLFFFFDSGRRYHATMFWRKDGLLGWQRLWLDDALPAAAVEGHTGPIMPEPLRTYVLTRSDCTCRPTGSYSFALASGRKPVVMHVIDLTGTEGLFLTGPDTAFFLSNSEHRHWKISVHWVDTETGIRSSYTALQFLDLLDARSINLPVGTIPETANYGNANRVLWQLLGRPVHAFAVPHDTVTFHAHDGDLYTWSRHYGSVRFGRDGIYDAAVLVPGEVADNSGTRATIRLDAIAVVGEEEVPLYSCVCENLEEPKEVFSIHVGSPFSGWEELGRWPAELGRLMHLRISDHSMDAGGIRSLSAIGVSTQTGEEGQQLFRVAFFDKRGDNVARWSLGGRVPIETIIDPIYGERASWDVSLYGGQEMVPRMQALLSPPAAMSQTPCGPYDGYLSGLP